ncbi:MAG: hypothetical protein ACOYJI_02365 [Anaerovoracaceae bacterium]|jgi:hypothetical protein
MNKKKIVSKITAVFFAAVLFVFGAGFTVPGGAYAADVSQTQCETIEQPESGQQFQGVRFVLTADAASSDSSGSADSEDSGDSSQNTAANQRTIRIGGIIVAAAAALGTWLSINRHDKK